MKKTLIAILAILATIQATAQVTVEAKLDSVIILIGDQTGIDLSVTMKEGETAQFPTFNPRQEITPGVEVLETTDCDTTHLDNGMVRLSRKYTITSFDDTLYYIPPLTVKVGGKDYTSKNLALKVLTVEVDTLHPNQFFPPKAVQENPFLWEEWAKPFWLSLLVLLLAAVAYYLYVRLKDNKPIVSKIRIIRKMLPHQKAMKEIERIKAEGIGQTGDQKLYYTRLTDTLRTYMQERFGINAMEMTSGEIIEQLKQVEDQSKFDELRQLLETADLVKFAKYSTMLNESDRDMASVVEFIQTTKKEDMPTIEKIKPNLTESDLRNKRARVVLKTAVVATTIAAAALLAWVGWTLWNLLGI
ncbi:MAG: hypothetical protein J5529_00475 [Prevotella sp.]|nr:hypothetical protein [Prevotella sp.]